MPRASHGRSCAGHRGIYEQYPGSRGVLKVLGLTLVILTPFAIVGAISRALRRRRRRRERNLRDLATIKEAVNDWQIRHGG